ncbi:GntR family transcriptional regulator [Micromonospora echinospora]|uniref:GntR family transcriptional regulator n=1 Tax=Micromonospora echinospora TaxID=1877 RepID=UPI0034360A5E
MPTPHYGQPRYRVIADQLRERIESGVIPPGALLPAESVLTVEFRASRGTIRRAIAVLREAGLVATSHGRGTHANPRHHGSVLNKSADPETRERHVTADPQLAAIFTVDVGTALLESESVIQIDGTIEAVVRIYRLPRSIS